VAGLPYAWGPVYRFPDPPPFSGAELWNPYRSLSGQWLRANLHAHGRAWRGLTTGEQPDQVVVDRYRSLGYDVAGVSDYQSIASLRGVVDTPPLYEHGFNIGKNHQLAIGAHAVDWFDFPLWQATRHQQYVIDRVKRKADLVSLNHPSTRDAYDANALHSLTGYDLIEVVNGPFTAEDAWDAALSSGHAVWAVASDDNHDVDDPHRTGIGWNMIDAPSTSTTDIVEALRAGRSYAVLRTGALEAANITTLEGVDVNHGTVTVKLRGAASNIAFVGQDGILRKHVSDVNAASYTLGDTDTYVRAVVTSPQTVLYLNPVIRWDGSHLPAPSASVDVAWTWIQRSGAVAAGVLLVLVRLRWRQRVTGVAARPALARRGQF
jgi:hypothetical protein